MSLFNGRSDPVLGLDIGSTSVKLVELSRKRNRYRLDAFAVEQLPATAIDNHNIRDAAAVGEAIRRACAQAGVRRKVVAAAVANSAVIARTLLLDAALAENDLAVEVMVEAERSIPYPIEDVALDFVSLGPLPGNPALRRVLLVACPRDQVLAREAALRHAGLEPAVVEVESQAQRRAAGLLWELGETDAAVLDIGASAIRLVALSGDQASLVGEQPRLALIDTDESAAAEEALRLGGRLLDDYSSSRSSGSVGRVLLAGGGAASPEFSKLASGRFGVDVQRADPFVAMVIGATVDAAALAGAAPALVTACGLALRGRR